MLILLKIQSLYINLSVYGIEYFTWWVVATPVLYIHLLRAMSTPQPLLTGGATYTDMKQNTNFLTLIDSCLTAISSQMITGKTVMLNYSLMHGIIINDAIPT